MSKTRAEREADARAEAKKKAESGESEDAPPKNETDTTGKFESSAPRPMTTEDPEAKAQATTVTPAEVHPDTKVPINTNPSPRGSNPNLGTSVRTPGNAAFITRNPPNEMALAAPNPTGDIGTVVLEEEPTDEEKKLIAKREALVAQDEDDAGKIKDEDGFLLPLKEQIASGAKTVITNLSGEVFINGKKYGPGRHISVPAEAYSLWKVAIDLAQNQADQDAYKAAREGTPAGGLPNETPAGELERKRLENREATAIDGITRSIT